MHKGVHVYVHVCEKGGGRGVATPPLYRSEILVGKKQIT